MFGTWVKIISIQEAEENKELGVSLLCERQRFPSASLLYVCSLIWTRGCSEEQISAPWEQEMMCYTLIAEQLLENIGNRDVQGEVCEAESVRNVFGGLE